MIRILVTGAGGQLGESIQKIASDYREIGFVFTNIKELDISDTSKVFEMFAMGQFNYCINCAAYTNVEQAEKNPEKAFLVNAESVKTLALACRTNNVVLFQISTDYVFDGEKRTPYETTDSPNPINVYGASKLKGEGYIQEVLQRYFIVRTSWLYSEYGKNFYRTILEKAKTEKELQITDEEMGCPTHAHNLAKYILSLIVSKRVDYGIHHFTDKIAMTWYGFARKILSENGLEEAVSLKKTKNYRTFAKRPKYSVLNCE